MPMTLSLYVKTGDNYITSFYWFPKKPQLWITGFDSEWWCNRIGIYSSVVTNSDIFCSFSENKKGLLGKTRRGRVDFSRFTDNNEENEIYTS